MHIKKEAAKKYPDVFFSCNEKTKMPGRALPVSSS